MRTIPILLTTAVAAGAVAAPAAAIPGLDIVYALAPAANAIHDGAPDVAGYQQGWRQGPIIEDVRWPFARRLSKVSGRELSELPTAAAMAAALRAALAEARSGGVVGVDEIGAPDWDPPTARRLAAALDRMGEDARSVIAYIAPGLVGQLSREDPRRPLPDQEAAVLEFLRRMGGAYLQTYNGDGTPFSRAAFAEAAVRWTLRWAPGDPARLHFILGPALGTTQEEVWGRARSTPEGRQMLRNGAGVWGLKTAQEGLDWLRQRTAFLAQPDAPPPGGDEVVPEGGGLEVTRPAGRTIRVTLARPGRAVIRLISLASGSQRVVGKVTGPVTARAVTLPRDVRPGRYRILVVQLGDGLRDTAEVRFTVTAAWGR